jgi:predicted RNA-binding Zn-ribbon protein involved in translation (DUF1610 family)
VDDWPRAEMGPHEGREGAEPSMTMASGDKREHLRRAKELFATGQSADLLYAALELRLCLEAMTYEKLGSFEKHLPQSFLDRTWQPPQLLKAMAQFDRRADKSFTLAIGVEPAPGVPVDLAAMKFIGEHKAFGLGWLRKHYNKLGSPLHLQRKNTVTDELKLRADLEGIADEIENAQTGSILGSWIGQLISFECHLCKEQVTVSRDFIEAEHRAVCLNPACEAEYSAEVEGDGAAIAIRAVDFPCTSCGEQIIVQTRHLASGFRVPCPACKRKHVIRCTWGYDAVDESQPQGAPSDE